MVEAIVDLTATGTTLREHDLIVREEIVECTARLIANPVAHKLQRGGDRRRCWSACDGCRRAGVLIERRSGSTRSPNATARPTQAAAAAAQRCSRASTRRSKRPSARSSRTCARRATRRSSEYTRSFDTDGAEPRAAAREQRGARRSARADAARRGRRAAGGDRQRRAGRRRFDRTRPGRVDLPQGHTRDAARAAGRRRRRIRARRARGLSEHGRDGRCDRARGRRAGRRRVHTPRGRTGRRIRRSSPPAGCAGSSASTGWAARRRSRRSPLAPRPWSAWMWSSGPGNLYVQEAKRRLSHVVGIDGFAGPSDLMVVFGAGRRPVAWWRSTCWPRPSTARAASSSRVSSSQRGARRARAGDRARGAPMCRPRTGRVRAGRDGDARGGDRALPTRSRRSTCSWWARPRRRWRSRCRTAGCLFLGRGGATAFGDYTAGSNHVLPTGGAARFASTLSPRHFRRRMSVVEIGDRRPSSWPTPARRSRAPRASHCTPARCRRASCPPSRPPGSRQVSENGG